MEKDQLIYGIRAIIEAVKAGTNLDKVFVQKDINNELMRELFRTLKSAHIGFTYVPVEKLQRLTSFNHQGVVATLAPVSFLTIEQLVETTLEKEKPALFLILDQLSDARNLGSIIRTASCTGVDGIILPRQGSAPINGDTVKTSAGAVFQVPLCKVDHIKDALFYLQSCDISVVAATEKTTNLLYDIDFTGHKAIIMGNEEKGIHPSLLKMADELAALPMTGTIASLNVSVACGAFLYEAVRQRKV
ncbi:MAG: 23S rRNA (guanosine(2251)-2'-O)-methyltransferase RlmB [Flavobacterium sp. BFFFF2]|nr:MAG: 23S rRNA (guanosine(2251)-2'-O)-methyltransferase RlmB [Flavobacterium sp. BFFFF2]